MIGQSILSIHYILDSYTLGSGTYLSVDAQNKKMYFSRLYVAFRSRWEFSAIQRIGSLILQYREK